MASLRTQVLLFAVGSLITWMMFVSLFRVMLVSVSNMTGSIILGITCFFSISLPFVSLLAFDLWRCDPSDNHSYGTMWEHYVIGWYRYITGRRQWARFKKYSNDVKTAQDNCLRGIIRANRGTKYGIEHALKQVDSTDDLINQHPLTNYSYYEPYLEHILDGMENVLNPERVKYLGITSGTSGGVKKFPILRGVVKEMLEATSMTNYANKSQMPHIFRLQKSLRVTPPLVAKEGPNNILLGPYSVAVTPKKFETFTTPSIANDISDELSLTYIHALFGLRERNLRTINFLFPPVAHRFIATLEKHWKAICHDTEKGTLNKTIDVPDYVRIDLEKLLEPNKGRAEEIKREFKMGFIDILPRLWPKLRSVELLTSATFYTSAIGLQRRYFGTVKVVSNCHAATEGFYGVNVNPRARGSPIYTPLVCHTVYEFIPIDEVMKDNPTTLLMEDKPEVGEDYELVVTTNRCIYRYRTGDVIRIMQYFGDIPQYKFMYRLDQTISIAGENTTEDTIQESIIDVLGILKQFSVVDYTITESKRLESAGHSIDGPPCYVLFIELQSDTNERETLAEAEKDLFDGSLQDISEEYESLRHERKLGSMKVIQLKRWSFLGLKDFLKEQNPMMGVAQYKTPKYVRQIKTVEFLRSREIGSG